jgi:hypothetical protein
MIVVKYDQAGSSISQTLQIQMVQAGLGGGDHRCRSQWFCDVSVYVSLVRSRDDKLLESAIECAFDIGLFCSGNGEQRVERGVQWQYVP